MPSVIRFHSRRSAGKGAGSQRGSLMIEVLVSVLILSLAVIGLIRVLATSVRDSGELEYRSVAATLADESIARMWVDRSNLAAHAVADETLSQLPNGKRTITVNGNVVTVTVTWQAPSSVIRQHQVAATIAGN